jgi:hypothetical protein
VLQAATEANVPFLASALTFDALMAAIPLLLILLAARGAILQATLGPTPVGLAVLFQRFFPAQPGSPDRDTFGAIQALLEKILDFGWAFPVVMIRRQIGQLRPRERTERGDLPDPPADERRPQADDLAQGDVQLHALAGEPSGDRHDVRAPARRRQARRRDLRRRRHPVHLRRARLVRVFFRELSARSSVERAS